MLLHMSLEYIRIMKVNYGRWKRISVCKCFQKEGVFEGILCCASFNIRPVA